jgi:hypothetical protein
MAATSSIKVRLMGNLTERDMLYSTTDNGHTGGVSKTGKPTEKGQCTTINRGIYSKGSGGTQDPISAN